MTNRLPYNMHPDCRAFAAEYMTAVCDWLKTRSKGPPPPELEEMRHELRRRERASFVWRWNRRWSGRAYGLKGNWYERNNMQRSADTESAWWRRQRDPEAHLEACRKWRDANRDYIRAANRYRYWQRKVAEYRAGLEVQKDMLKPAA